MTHLVDAEHLIDTFAETDPRMPLVVFSLLSLYLRDGPFEFDAAQLAERLSTLNMKARLNPEELAALQPDLERFFEPAVGGWRPRPGVLDFEGGSIGNGNMGALPGEARH